MTVSPARVSSQLPPVSAAMSTITAPGFMRATASLRMMRGAARPGTGGRRNHRVRGGDVLLEHFLLLRLLLGRELAGVAACALGADAGLDELRAQRLDLFAGGRAHVVGLDDGAQALRRGDGLQPGDARADHQHLRRADGARRRWSASAGTCRASAPRSAPPCSRRWRLRGQRVHRLRARDARHRAPSRMP